MLFLEIRIVLCDPAALRNLFLAEGHNTKGDEAVLGMRFVRSASFFKGQVMAVCVIWYSRKHQAM